MQWLEALARRQGAKQEEPVSSADLPPPPPSIAPATPPAPTAVDEEGGLSNDPEALKRWLAAQAASLQKTRETAEVEAVIAPPEPIAAAPVEIPDWLKDAAEHPLEPSPEMEIPDWLVDAREAKPDGTSLSIDDLLAGDADLTDDPALEPSSGEAGKLRKTINRLIGKPKPLGAEESPAEQPAPSGGVPIDAPRTRDVPKMTGAVDAKPTAEVNFTAFYPRTAQAERRYGLYVYAHLPEVIGAIQQDAEKFVEELGGSVPSPRTAKQSARVADRTPITITPEADGLEFDPPSLSKRWSAPHVRYEFDFTPNAALVGDEVQGRLSITIAGIEVAHLKFSIEVNAGEVASMDGPPAATLGFVPQSFAPPSATFTDATAPNNPLAAAKLTHTAPTKLYSRIFVSYSRQDQVVAEAYRLAQLAIGNEVFMDTYSIRVGEDWRVALAKAIDGADIFQLFWSENAAASENVRHEWDYALNYRCPDTKCAEFIRPVFWKAPIPVEPPSALSHLNFRYVPLSRYVSHASLDDPASRPS
jgi:hypothetical protein